MNICYLILAHKNPDQLYRMVSKLNGEGVNFFIHINQREETFYSQAKARLSEIPNVYFTARRKIWWGTFSVVDAILTGMREIAKSSITYDRLVLLSGQDYPIKSNDYLKTYFSDNAQKNYIEYFALDTRNKWTNGTGLYDAKRRSEYWYFTYRSRIIYLPVKRKLPKGLVPYGGSLWWNLNRECVEYIVGFVENNPDFINFMRHTFLPDEMFFQTILLNSPLRPTLVNADLRYIDWEKANPTPPATLLKEDFPSLIAATALFARKFDMARDADILDLIDQEILANQETPGLSKPEYRIKALS
jgi:Core-2/I-Branching enzyme